VTTPWHDGQIIGGRYRLDRHLGSGAAAAVWRAFDVNLRAPVAIKLLDPGFAGTSIATRFLREARAAAQIRSLHVVQILDHGEHEGTAYITMELLEGETLADRLDRVRRLPNPKVARIIGGIAKAATKAHDAGIIHRDLKPGNVFLVHGEDDDEEVVKVFDFGIAKIDPHAYGSHTGATKSGTILGTPTYMSPEQAIGGKVDHRTDIYAIGIVAFECVTGELPFESESIGEILRLAAEGTLRSPSSVCLVPRAFDAWFAKATHPDPTHRFANAKEMAASLRTALA